MMNCTRMSIARLLALTLTTALAAPVFADSQALIDLLAVLRDKGTLTSDEYAMLVAAARAEASPGVQSAPTVEQATVATVSPANPPITVAAAPPVPIAAAKSADEKSNWTDRLTLKGDLRTRYEYQKDDYQDSRTRGRLRYRLGVIADAAPGIEVGAGLASGSRDQRSTNQSFGGAFSGKDLNLDYAYMQYRTTNGLSGIAGKFSFRNYLWTPSDVMWDTDINPEGFSLDYTGTNALGKYFANTGIWVLEENRASSKDPYMAYGQLGQGWVTGDWSTTAAVTGYAFVDINKLSDISRFDGRNTDSKLSSVNLALEVGHPLGAGQMALLGEYIRNIETNTKEDTAWTLGWRYKLGPWNAKYIYADVDINAVPDFLPDSDRDQGFTGERGHEFEVQYELMKNVAVALDYYHVFDRVLHIQEDLVQADVNVKF